MYWCSHFYEPYIDRPFDEERWTYSKLALNVWCLPTFSEHSKLFTWYEWVAPSLASRSLDLWSWVLGAGPLQVLGAGPRATHSYQVNNG